MRLTDDPAEREETTVLVSRQEWATVEGGSETVRKYGPRSNWLNDNIVDAFIYLMGEHKDPSIKFFSVSFMEWTKLVGTKESVRRWKEGRHIFENRYLVFPYFHGEASHFYLFLVDLPEEQPRLTR